MSRSKSRLVDCESYSVCQFHLYVKVELLPKRGDELLDREPVIPGSTSEALRLVLRDQPLHEVRRLVAELARIGDDKGDEMGFWALDPRSCWRFAMAPANLIIIKIHFT